MRRHLRPALACTALVLAASTSACSVGPAPATIVGGAPDTSTTALAARDPGDPELPADVGVPPTSSSTPASEDAPGEGTSPVLLWSVDGPRWAHRDAGPAHDDTVVDAVRRLARPLDDHELSAGLTTHVPPGTDVDSYDVTDAAVRVRLRVPPVGGTDETLDQLTRQVACTVHRAIDAPPHVVVEVVLDGAGTTGTDGSACY